MTHDLWQVGFLLAILSLLLCDISLRFWFCLVNSDFCNLQSLILLDVTPTDEGHYKCVGSDGKQVIIPLSWTISWVLKIMRIVQISLAFWDFLQIQSNKESPWKKTTSYYVLNFFCKWENMKRRKNIRNFPYIDKLYYNLF